MEFLALKDISEQFMDLVNPTTPDKILAVGEVAGLSQGQRVVDFGSGYGEVLALWAERFGIAGLGIDIRPHARARARRKLADRGLDERIEIACADAGAHPVEPHAYHVAACIGATFIWQDFGQAVAAMQKAIRPGGRLVIGEVYWRTSLVPAQLAREQQSIHAEVELLEMARAGGCTIEQVVRSSTADWDRYESSNWRGLLHWLGENPDHPERQEVLDHFHASQDEYLRFGREYFGWALYVLRPMAGAR